MKKNHMIRLVLSALFLAIGFVLPFLTGQIPEVGSMLLTLHLPALICGVVCGRPWGLLVGFVLPIARSLLFGMPPLVPTRIKVSAPTRDNSSIAIAADGPPMPVEQAVTFSPSSVPVHTLYSRLQAT